MAVDDKKKYAYNYLIGKGLSPIAAAGIVGNLVAESGLNTTIPGKADDKGSIGIAQWHSDRKQGLMTFANKVNKPFSSLSTQLDYLVYELKSPAYSKALAGLNFAKTPGEASIAFMNHYEKPAEWAKKQSVGKRVGEATSIYTGKPYEGINYSEDSEETFRDPNLDFDYNRNPTGATYTEEELEEAEAETAKQELLQKQKEKDFIAEVQSKEYAPQQQQEIPQEQAPQIDASLYEMPQIALPEYGNTQLPTMQFGGFAEVGKIIKDFEKAKAANKDRNKFLIKDTRKISATTGKPLNPNSDIVTGKYDKSVIRNLALAASKHYADPYTSVAVGLQESKLGTTDDNIGHIIGKHDTKFTGSEEEDLVRVLQDKLKYAKDLGIEDEATMIQAYNGLGKIFPQTEKRYHGFEMKKIYGVPVPKSGIDMKKTPLYGKRVIDLRDNVIKKNPEVVRYIENLPKYNHFSGKYEEKFNPLPMLNYEEGGETGGKITCNNCGWSWDKSESSQEDMYNCHKCGGTHGEESKYQDGGLTEKDRAVKTVGKVAEAAYISSWLNKIPFADTAYDAYNLINSVNEGDFVGMGSNLVGAIMPGFSGKVIENVAQEYLPKQSQLEKDKFKFNLKSSPSDRQKYLKQYGPGYLNNPGFIKNELYKKQEGGLIPGTPEYEKAYNDYNVFNYDKSSDTYVGRELDPVVVKGKPRQKGFWNGYFDNVAREHSKDGPLGAIIGTTLDAVAGLPQKAMTYAFTNKVQTPSQAMNIQNPVGAFAVDAVTDPMNLVGAGLLTKEKALSNIAKNAALPNMSDLRPFLLKAKNQANLVKDLMFDKNTTLVKNTIFDSKNKIYKEVEKGYVTLDNALEQKIKDLNTPEGKKRLINQEKEYLQETFKDNPYYNDKFYDSQSKINAEKRVEELENIQVFGNKNKNFVYQVGRDKVDKIGIFKPNIEDVLRNRDIPNSNAHYAYNMKNTSWDIKGEKMLPGDITLGRGFTEDTPTAFHEINHALQRGRRLKIDDDLKDIKPDYKKNLSYDNIDDYNYFNYGSAGQEPSSFLAELRSVMLKDGFLKDTYDEVTPELIEKAKKYYADNKNKKVILTNSGLRGLTNTRILDFSRATPENYKIISDAMNKLPSAIPAAIGLGAASQIENKKYGGYYPKFN